jgi:CMP-N,N'-diacetyllegionaminic acid synthase
LAAPRLLILVPARGGSKGLPRKNVRILGGKPLLAWTADVIRHANLPGAVAVLSTDDDEIAEAGRRAGLLVPFRRPTEHATDEAKAEAVALHALDWFAGAHHGQQPEAVMLLQPTSPFRPSQALAAADGLLSADARLEAVVGVKSIPRTLATLFRMDANGDLSPLSAEPAQSRRQEVVSLYTPNGAMYLVRTAVLRAGGGFFPSRSRALVMDALASLDIDDETDWRLAEAVAASRVN